MAQVIPCPPSPTNLQRGMDLLNVADISSIGLPLQQLVTPSHPPKQRGSSSLSEAGQSKFELISRPKSVSSLPVPRKRSFSTVSRPSNKSFNSKKQRTNTSRYFQSNVTSSRFDFSFVAQNRSIGAKSINSTIIRSRSPIRGRPPAPDPLTPFKDGQISWPFKERFRSRSRSRSHANNDTSDDDGGGEELSNYVPRRFASTSGRWERKRLIDKLNGKSFVLDREPSSSSAKHRHKPRRAKRTYFPSASAKPALVWVEKYEEIAKRDAEAEARIRAMGEY